MMPSPPRWFLVLPALLACSESGPLALAEDWELVPPSEDPIPGRPDGIAPCPTRAAILEAGALEVDTTLCGWITLRAPARIRLGRGAEVEVFVFHQALSAPEPAQAVISVSAGEPPRELWRRDLAVPSASAFYDDVVELDEPIRPDESLFFHVHNHGANTYTLGHLQAP